ncbi:hypothetical protein N2152v2_000333 [Parachlorella kessleri]
MAAGLTGATLASVAVAALATLAAATLAALAALATLAAVALSGVAAAASATLAASAILAASASATVAAAASAALASRRQALAMAANPAFVAPVLPPANLHVEGELAVMNLGGDQEVLMQQHQQAEAEFQNLPVVSDMVGAEVQMNAPHERCNVLFAYTKGSCHPPGYHEDLISGGHNRREFVGAYVAIPHTPEDVGLHPAHFDIRVRMCSEDAVAMEHFRELNQYIEVGAAAAATDQEREAILNHGIPIDMFNVFVTETEEYYYRAHHRIIDIWVDRESVLVQRV